MMHDLLHDAEGPNQLIPRDPVQPERTVSPSMAEQPSAVPSAPEPTSKSHQNLIDGLSTSNPSTPAKAMPSVVVPQRSTPDGKRRRKGLGMKAGQIMSSQKLVAEPAGRLGRKRARPAHLEVYQ